MPEDEQMWDDKTGEIDHLSTEKENHQVSEDIIFSFSQAQRKQYAFLQSTKFKISSLQNHLIRYQLKKGQLSVD